MTNKEKEELQKEIVDCLEDRPHGRLILAPRIGKTKIVITIIKKNAPKSILWVTPQLNLIDNIREEFEKWKAKKYLKKLDITTWASLNKIEGYYDLIVFDEEQFITDNNTYNLRISNKLTYGYIISMTGTQANNKDKDEIYDELNLRILYKLSINDAVDLKLLSDYCINVVEVDLSTSENVIIKTKTKEFKKSEKDQYQYLTNQVNNSIMNNKYDKKFKIRNRMHFIYNSISKNKVAKFLIDNLKGRSLFFCSNQKQAEYLCKDYYHSKTNNQKLLNFISGKINKITMVNSGGIGQTYKNIDDLIIIQANSDNTGLTSQKICRTLLSQNNYKANIWIICLMNTQDEVWVNNTLSSFNPLKIKRIKFNTLENNKEILWK